MSKKHWNKGMKGTLASSASGSNETSKDSLHYLIRQIKDLREPMHILMDCWPSFLTVPVFKSRMRPKEGSKNKMLSQFESFPQHRHQVTH